MGQSLPKRDVRVKSAHPPISDIMLQRVKSKWANFELMHCNKNTADGDLRRL